MGEHIAVVTGGAQGIGRAITDAFVAHGTEVVVVDRDQEALDELPDSVLAYGMDVEDASAIEQFGHWVSKRFSRVHVLVNNAGMGFHQAIGDTSVALWDRVLNVNLRAYYLMVQALLGPLEGAQGASVVNIASTRALMSEADTEAYSASKGGVLALTHALAVSLSLKKIRVNAVSPGWIATEQWKKSKDRRDPEIRPVDHRQHPSGRVGTPLDIARAVLFLANPENGFINGTNLIVDGGMTIKMMYEE